MGINVGQSTYRFRGAERGDHNSERVWWSKKSRPGVCKDFLRERIQKRWTKDSKRKREKLKGLFLSFSH